MKLFSKVAAVLCGAATVAAAGAALSASAVDKPTIYADQVYAEPGQIVDFSLNIEGNTGYAGSGIGLYYDERLEPQGVSDLEIEGTYGPASTNLAQSLLCNTKKLRVGWTSSGTKDNDTDGAIYTVRFKVPDDAQAGDTFNMQVVVTQFCTAKNVDIDYDAVDGWIKIKDVTTTSETTTTTSETTTSSTTKETTTSETTTTTLSDTTTSSSSQETTTLSSSDETTTTTLSDVSGEGTETTTETGTGEPGTDEPGTNDTGSGEPGTDASTESTNNGGNGGGNDQPGVHTGDAGVALAIAGLLTAAGAAVVIRRKH